MRAVTRLLTLSLLCAALGGCREIPLEAVGGGLVTDPRHDFASVYVGAHGERTLALENVGRRPLPVRLEAPPPFHVAEGALVLAPGERRTLPLRFVPVAEGAFSAVLRVRSEGGTREVALSGRGLTPAACSPGDPCRVARFDAAAGACVETPLADGTACESACLTRGSCRAGTCVGTAIVCDDGDACTVDACEPGRGCVHPARSCAAPEEPCLAASCDPQQGCVQVEVADGTRCGGPLRCGQSEMRVCLAGACSRVPAPPGEPCTSAPCEMGADGSPGPLQEAWRLERPERVILSGDGGPLADSRGRVFWLEAEVSVSSSTHATFFLVGVDPAGRVLFRHLLGGGVYSDPRLLMTGEAVLVATQEGLTAYAPASGDVLWSHSLQQLAQHLVGDPEPADSAELVGAASRAGTLVIALWAEWLGRDDARGLLELSLADGTLRASAKLPEAESFVARFPDSPLVMDASGVVYAMLAPTIGTLALERWGPGLESLGRVRLGVPDATLPLAVAHGTLLYSTFDMDPARGERPFLNAWSTQRASPRWRAPLEGPRTALLHGQTLATLGPSAQRGSPSQLLAAEVGSGRPLWSREGLGTWREEPPRNAWLAEAGELLEGAMARACLGSPCQPESTYSTPHLAAYASRTGETLWQCQGTRGKWETPLFSVSAGERWVVWQTTEEGRPVVVSYALPGWAPADSGWPQYGGGPGRTWSERGP
jgi:outer membrane protein assembly factor BamB